MEQKKPIEPGGSRLSEHLDLEAFRNKVFDFVTHTSWKFEGNLPALVNFWAPWCGLCRMVAPVIEELSGEFAGRLIVYTVNTDEHRELARLLGVQSIPSLLLIPVNGRPKVVMGTLPKNELKRIIQSDLLLTTHHSAIVQ